MLSVTACAALSIGLARLSGRSTGTAAVSKGAVTMKMISSTSMTSTSGVTLISAIGVRRPRPRREWEARPIAIYCASSCRLKLAWSRSAKRWRRLS
jgi:hypothetical protein